MTHNRIWKLWKSTWYSFHSVILSVCYFVIFFTKSVTKNVPEQFVTILVSSHPFFISFVQWKMSLSIQVMEGTRIISFAQINELLNGFLDLWSDDPPVRPKMYNSPFWLRRRQSRHHTRNRYARSGREDELIYMSSALSKAHYDLNGTSTVNPSN